MNTPMHRFRYSKLTREQIANKLEQSVSGPKCVSDLSDTLAGKSLKIITDNGPALSYSFKDNSTLIFSENGGSSISAHYGLLDLKHMVFLSYMVPDTLKGYNLFLDLKTNLVTLFEVWFCGGKESQGQELDNRELQREIYFGYIDVPGQTPPEKRHHTTNRIQGKGMYWRQDTGIETLDFYPSVVSSTFVELTRHSDNLGFSSPSDYILVDDNIFIYDRTECEFSGIMTLYMVDQLTEEQIGVRLGFNEKDELEYYLFRGKGKTVGHLSRLEPFDEDGRVIKLGMGLDQEKKTKGQRLVYRPGRDIVSISEEEMHLAAEKRTESFKWDPDMPKEKAAGSMSENALPLTDILAGKNLILRYDNNGPVWEYRVTDRKTLSWRILNETEWHTESYRAFEIDEGLVFFAHIQSGSRPRKNVKIAVDLINGLTTCIESRMGNEYSANEISYKTFFGIAEMEGVEAPRYKRHDFTDELVGKAYSRTWGAMTSMHLYTTPHSATWTIYTDDQTLGMQWSAPCIYVKLREGVYIFDLHEEAGTTYETCIAINNRTMRVSGFEYHGDSTGVDLSVIGAIGRPIGCYDVKEYFG
ncbi:MAG: hypothetical protein GX654_09615 [Desulfatiglans sp.]|nr:hypothetical protein [Desulfatiglans sp.]